MATLDDVKKDLAQMQTQFDQMQALLTKTINDANSIPAPSPGPTPTPTPPSGPVESANGTTLNSTSGQIYDAALSNPNLDQGSRFVRFLELERESTRLLELEPEQDTSREQAAVNAELEAHYLDYIESEQWHLIDAAGTRHPILCPILHGPGGIVWRWNPTAD